MSTLEAPAARLYYDIQGSGPYLFMIPGGTGTGEVFKGVAEYLATRYTVVSYDRRGFSRSQLDGPQDYSRRLETDANDVRLLIKRLTDQPAHRLRRQFWSYSGLGTSHSPLFSGLYLGSSRAPRNATAT